jgi:hypothetical protein
MRPLFTILMLAALLLPIPATADSPSFLTGLFGTQARYHVVHRRSVKQKPAAPKAPVVPAAAQDSTAKPALAGSDTSAVPLPRPRPEPPEALTPASPPPENAAAVPVPASKPQAAATSTPPTPPAGPQSTPLVEGESATAQPPRVYQTACPAVISGLVEAKPLPPIADGMCEEQSPLSVTSILVNGRSVPLSAPAIFNCEMASDLPGWVADVDSYIFVMQKTRIKAVTVGGSYECRDRNVEGGSSDLSEHGRADALDFVGFTLEDGRTLTVGQDYNSADAPTNRLMHFAHDAACTRFTTVLGPDANALHHDHFHLDLGCHGKTCTYRLCE